MIMAPLALPSAVVTKKPSNIETPQSEARQGQEEKWKANSSKDSSDIAKKNMTSSSNAEGRLGSTEDREAGEGGHIAKSGKQAMDSKIESRIRKQGGV